MKTIIFKVIQQSTGHEWELYNDGSVKGFPANCIVHNSHSLIVDQLEAKISIASACPDRCDSSEILGSVDISD